MVQSGKYHERRTLKARRWRKRLLHRYHPELEDLFDFEEDEYEACPCVCGDTSRISSDG